MLSFTEKTELPLPSFSDTYDITLSASTGVSFLIVAIAGWSRKQGFLGDIEKTYHI